MGPQTSFPEEPHATPRAFFGRSSCLLGISGTILGHVRRSGLSWNVLKPFLSHHSTPPMAKQPLNNLFINTTFDVSVGLRPLTSLLLGRSWARTSLGRSWGSLGRFLGALWDCSWTLLGLLGAALGLFLSAPVLLLGTLGPLLGALGPQCGTPVPIWDPFETHLQPGEQVWTHQDMFVGLPWTRPGLFAASSWPFASLDLTSTPNLNFSN
jgi:hypothetical protein